MAEKLCNLCGLSCHMPETEEDQPGGEPHGLVEASARGGYLSTPGNGYGALDDTIEYKFTLCEWCLDWLFDQFQIPVKTRDYLGVFPQGEPQEEPWRPAAQRVAEDDWRKSKDRFFQEYERRNQARAARQARNTEKS